MKKKLCLSFSLGETSAFMTEWCLNNFRDEYEMVVVCANTGEEDEKSLIFGHQCDLYFGWNMVWVECITNPDFGVGATAKVVDFETASRNGGNHLRGLLLNMAYQIRHFHIVHVNLKSKQ